MRTRHLWPIVAAVAGAATVLAAPGVKAAPSACNPAARLVGRTVAYCGPARASLSTLAGAGFTSGSCRTTSVNGVPQFTLKLGVRTPNARTNDGKPYFGLIVTGPLSRPTGGGVVAYWKGRRWGGVGVAFRGNARAGSFVASGVNVSHGHATGSYRC